MRLVKINVYSDVQISKTEKGRIFDCICNTFYSFYNANFNENNGNCELQVIAKMIYGYAPLSVQIVSKVGMKGHMASLIKQNSNIA